MRRRQLIDASRKASERSISREYQQKASRAARRDVRAYRAVALSSPISITRLARAVAAARLKLHYLRSGLYSIQCRRDR
jgi:hypothetical protein